MKQYQKYFKAILAIIATIIIGAIGSGVWEHILEPTLIYSRDTLLNISTLGIKSFKDSIYVVISKGFHEKHSLTIQSYIFMAFVVFIILFSIKAIKDSYKIKQKIDDLINKINGKHSRKTNEELLCELNSMKTSKLIKSSYALLLMNVFASVLFFFGFYVDFYINSAITHFNQMNNIVAPYISENEIIKIKSDFAQIKDRESYKIIIMKLEKISIQNNLSLPKFDIW